MVYQAFHAAEAGCEREQFAVRDKSVHGFARVVFQINGYHAAEAAHLAFGQLVMLVAGQGGVEHFFNGGVAAQFFGDDLRVFQMLFHAHGKRFDAAQHQPAVHRPCHAACFHHHVVQRFGEFVVFDYGNAHQHIRMPAQVFGGGMEHDVAAQIQRGLAIGRGKGVVDADDCAVRFGFLRQQFNVHQAKQRVRWGFQPQHFHLMRSKDAV